MVFSSRKKIMIRKDLHQQLITVAQDAGYSSADEFIEHVLERETKNLNEQIDEREAERQLRGLGYID
jgi:hypothetical protein